MIKEILDEIAAESGTKAKMRILGGYKDNELLKEVLYMTKSRRVKFYIKQIPEYSILSQPHLTLDDALNQIKVLSDRKVTGHDAINHLRSTLEGLSESDAYVIERIIEKDLKIGMGTSNMNKVISELIEKTNYMGAIPFNDKKVRDIFAGEAQGISEVKADGRYCNAVIRGGEVELVSRQGESTLLGGGILLDELTKFDDCVLNGELVIDGIKRETSNGLITSVINISKKLNSEDEKDNKKAQKSIEKILKKHGLVYTELLNRIRFIVWDILDIEEYFINVCNVKRIDRLNRLVKVIGEQDPSMISLVEHKFVNSYEEAIEHFSEMLESGEEGTVLKSMGGVWRHGKHSYQIKMKLEFDLDLKIIEFNYGNKGTKNENVISSVTCESSCGRLVTRAQGIPEDLMEYITGNQDKLRGTILTVKCNGLSTNQFGGHSVSYPVLKELRDDKVIANSLSECVNIDAAAKGLKKII